MPKLEGVTEVKQQLQKLFRESKRENNVSVTVGYTADYAVFVHENMNAEHTPGQKAKYLEEPAEELAQELGTIVAKVADKTGSLEKGLIIGGLRLQAASQRIVPVDTGNLKGSAFTRVEKGGGFDNSVPPAQRSIRAKKKRKK